MSAQDRHPQGGAGEVRPLNVEGSAGEPNPSVDDIPADVEARIKARVMAEIRLVCKVCRDVGLILAEDREPEWCDCARGEDLREQAEWAAGLNHAIREDQPW